MVCMYQQPRPRKRCGAFAFMGQHKHLYDKAAWRRLRLHQLAKRPLCALHGELGQIKPASVVDHIRPHGGDMQLFFDEGNLQSLCKSCHDSHKQAQERNANGLMRGAGLSGSPLDRAHPWHQSPATPTQGGG